MTATILVIDDSADDQRLYQRALRDVDCRLVLTSTGEDGFASATCLKPDLILLDYNLPDSDGLSFMKKLAKFTDTPIPIVMLTGEGNTEVAVEAMKHGADDYLVKDTEGRYLRLLPGLVGRVMSSHAQREKNKRLQQETETLLRRNRALMKNSTDGIHVMDVEGNLLEANDAFYRMLGYTPEDAPSLSVADWNAQWSAEQLRAKFKDMVGKSAMFETLHRRKDGTLIDVEVSTSGVEIDGKHLFFAASRDITRRKHAEEAQKLSAQLLNSTSDSVFLIDLDGKFIYLNEAAWKSRGYAQDELMAMNVRELTTPEPGKLIATRIKELLEKGHVVFESEHRCKDGSIISVEVCSRLIESSGRKLILSSSRDITDRKKTEAMLMQHKLVIDTSIDGFWVSDMQGHLLEANEAYAKMSGYSVDELLGMHISQLEAIEQQPQDVHAHIAKVVAQGHDRFETRHRHKDGHEIYIEVSVTYMAEPQRMFVFCRDITERTGRDKAINHARMELQDLYDQAPCGYHSLDSEGRIVKINQTEADWLGYERAELIGRKIQEVQTPSSLLTFAKNYPVFKEKGHIENVEYELVRKDGSTFFVLLSATIVKDADGNFIMSRSSMIDITERKRAEVALQQSEANLRAMLDNSPYMTWLKDTKGRYISINKVFADYLRLEDAGQAVGKTDLDLQPKELAKKYRADDAEVMAARLRKTVEESAFDGKNIHWVETSKTPIIDNQGRVLGTVGFARDITERKRAEEKLLLESKTEHKRAEALAQQFGHLLSSSFNEIFLFDAESLRYMQASEGAKKTLGYSADELQQLTPLDLNPSFTRNSFEKLVAPLRNGKLQSLLVESFHRRKDGTAYPVEERLQLITTEPAVFVAVVQDITERRQAESQLQNFTTHLQTVREEEKARIAREIHDELGGTLIALKMDTSWLAGKLSEDEGMLALQKCARSMSELLDTAVKAMRRIITDLRPSVLDDLGLMAALKWQSSQFQQRTGIECQTTCCNDDDNDCEDMLDKTHSIHLFRIVQEALTNVARHSGASKVDIRLNRSDEGIVLKICDNGRGLPDKHIVAPTSHGVRGMCERVKQLGGQIKFDSPPGGKFCITVTLPQPAGSE